ncbi:uncharacterized protein LOC119603398 [Lucilia sericata]|uniref:uncharacterized protein LOC119603398 n=1 Tax=Lucilia sericata TaxID=13632 RepID=UPI0018A843AE|nr:uncharacterized protein LOC119603398 [Lucilia sericata]
MGWTGMSKYHRKRWLKYKSSLPQLAKLKIPRWIRWSRESKIELHCFSDASTAAYAADIYSRIINPNGIFVNILQAKSKVSPIKTISIPRLELCAANLLVKLAQSVKEALADMNIDNIYYWSASSTVLSWTQRPPSSWTVYVANRVADIQRLSNTDQWRYVPSVLNPADCASRGVFPEDLVDDQTWWFGPQFLYKPLSFWPKGLSNLHTSEEQILTKCSSNTCSKREYPEILFRFSTLRTLLRTITLCFRFIYNCKNPKLKRTSFLRISEINETLLILIKLTQLVDFPNEIKLLSTNRDIKQSFLLKLMPFLDEKGIIRVGGRLQTSTLSYNVKHPIVLATSNPLSEYIIKDSHERTLPGGITLTMSVGNRKFWIVSGNQLAKSKCFRYSAKTSQQVMGNLPYVRLNVTRPFKHSGVDYAGPITLKNSTLRSAVISKGYICLFVCMVTKAIHLEAVSDLSTNAFLAAFKRFESRRGACSDIYSDCGTNFGVASKELQILYNRNIKSLPNDLRQALSLNCTNWHFIPPASPNFGGLWEAGVKSVKHHLKRITNNRLLSFEELATLLCQIESCLNSRPLCPLSSDPSDFDALTPAHLLVGEPLQCVQKETLLDQNINHLTRWKSVELLKQHFWKRWYREYLKDQSRNG